MDNSLEGKTLSSLPSPESSRAAHQPTVVVVPTGAVEQHGPHLPLGTDTFIATAIAERVASRLNDVLVAEPLSYGCSWHHLGLPGTVSLRTRTFISLTFDVCGSLSKSGFVPVLLNGHHGNGASLRVALTELAEAGVRAYTISYFDLLGDAVFKILPEPKTSVGHACALETSLMMHLHPGFVAQDEIPSGGTPTTWPDPHMYGEAAVSVVRPFEEINETGVIGRPELGSAQQGKDLFEAAVSLCTDAVRRILREAQGRRSEAAVS
jgi:creatinine amidohydrolase